MMHQNTNRGMVDPKRPYASPTLVIYGTLGSLTAGGSGTGTEPGTIPGACGTDGSNAVKTRC